MLFRRRRGGNRGKGGGKTGREGLTGSRENSRGDFVLSGGDHPIHEGQLKCFLPRKITVKPGEETSLPYYGATSRVLFIYKAGKRGHIIQNTDGKVSSSKKDI